MIIFDKATQSGFRSFVVVGIFMCIPFLARNGVNVSKLAHILCGNYFQCHFFMSDLGWR